MRFPSAAFLFLLGLAVSAPAGGADKKPDLQREEIIQSLSRELAAGRPIELKALEIRARIYEPQVIYVLDRAKVDVDFKEEDVRFSPRIVKPILNNEF